MYCKAVLTACRSTDRDLVNALRLALPLDSPQRATLVQKALSLDEPPAGKKKLLKKRRKAIEEWQHEVDLLVEAEQ